MDTQKRDKTDSANRDEVIDKLFREMYQSLFGLARGYLDPFFAESVVQDTFLTATQKFDSMMDSGNAKGWLVNTLKHKIQNAKRWKQTQEKHHTLVEAPEAYISANDADKVDFDDGIVFREMENACIQEVGKEAFELFKERYFYRIPIKDAAAKHGLSESAYKNRTARTRIKLQKFLKKLF